MPFIQERHIPKEPPAVKILLTGQLLLQPDETGSFCEVFVNRSASNHYLTIEVREKHRNRPDMILMRHHGPLEFRDPDSVEGLLIRREPAGSVRMYTGGPTAYGEGLAAIDLRGEGFHPGNELSVDFDSVRPSIMIEDGLFLTAAKTSDKVKMKLKKGEKEARDLAPFASLIGANVYLNSGEFLRLSWREMGLSRTLELTRTNDGTTFEIYIINDPLYQDPEAAKTHNEFAEYYKVLPTVPIEERLTLEFEESRPVTAAAAMVEKGTSRIPCMPVIISGL